MPLVIDQQRLAEICHRHRIVRIELFGSHARGTARPDSDVDLLVTFAPGATPGLEFFGLAVALESLCGRHVDLLTPPCVERAANPYFRDSMLPVAEPLYAA